MKNKSKDKWYIIYAKTLEIKQEWMDAFHRERTRVLEDHDKGMLYNIHKAMQKQVGMAGPKRKGCRDINIKVHVYFK